MVVLPLAAPPVPLHALWRLLDEYEKARARALKGTVLRRRYVCAHGMLRCVLAEATATPPESTQIVRDAHGKPSLANPCSQALSFSFSHSEDLAVVALAHGMSIGCDIELRRTFRGVEDVMALSFTSREREYVLRQSGDSAGAAFWRVWTRKEAYLKAIGRGFFVPPGDVDVNVPSDVAWLPLAADHSSQRVMWHFREVEYEDCAISVAAPAQPSPLRVWRKDWSDQPALWFER